MSKIFERLELLKGKRLNKQETLERFYEGSFNKENAGYLYGALLENIKQYRQICFLNGDISFKECSYKVLRLSRNKKANIQCLLVKFKPTQGYSLILDLVVLADHFEIENGLFTREDFGVAFYFFKDSSPANTSGEPFM